MASISSTNSTSSLGNTSLRGFGGMASGIDRDSIIEQMTLGTTTKINNQKKKITQLQWKQEAYMNISDKIIDLTDKYASYSSSSNLKDPIAFAKNVISIHGKESSTSFVTAKGTSDLVNNVSILGVGQLATSAVQRSAAHRNTVVGASGGNYGTVLSTSVDDLNEITYFSKLIDAKLNFITYNGEKRETVGEFEFKTSYTDDDGKEVRLNYAPQTAKEYQDLENGLNALAKEQGELVKFKFKNTADGKKKLTVLEGNNAQNKNIWIDNSSSAIINGALGYEKKDGDDTNKGIALNTFSGHQSGSFEENAVIEQSKIDFLADRSLYFKYDGSQKEITLITDGERNAVNAMTVGGSFIDKDSINDKSELEQVLKDLGLEFKEDESLTSLRKRLNTELVKLKDIPEGTRTKEDITKINNIEGQLEKIKTKQMDKLKEVSKLQERLDQAFGRDKDGNNMVKVNFDADKGISFSPKKDTSTLSVVSSDYSLLYGLGISYGESNKINLSGKLNQGALASTLKTAGLMGDDGNLTDKAVTDGYLNLKINGVEIKGLTKDSSISDILSKINSSNAGVKATYVDATGEFMLMASETGEGGFINLDESELAKALFGGTFEPGKNAEIYVSYGGGTSVTLDRASNTFDLEGLSVTVSGTFGSDSITNNADAVTFSAKADVDAAVEKVKTFFEDFNALVTGINSEITTRPDSSYQPLTDEQKDQMDETSIENWEKKAKQGMLYGDSNMRDLSVAVQSIFTKMMSNGASYEDLKEIGITYSEDYGDGGTLVFDESAFRTAMENNPEKVSRIFTGGNGISKGLINVVEDTFTPYATRYANRNGGSYGRLVEIAGTNKKPTTLMNNDIYKQLKEMQETIDSLNQRLKTEQDRYISQFTTMETLLNKMNTQSSYLSQIGV